MIRSAVILWLSSFAVLLAEERLDLLRFTNSDQLHGTFLGIKEGPQAIWRRDDVDAPVEFKTERLRHVVLHGGQPLKSLESLSNASLVNGDRIPGSITAIETEHITLETAFAGVLRIPRTQVSMLSPNPLGGRVYYHGPFSEDGWKMKHSEFPAGLPDEADEDLTERTKGNKEAAADDSPGRWEFSGSSWYWQNKNFGTALIREAGMPDRAVLSFDITWKNRLSFAVAFHADFAQGKAKEKNDPNKKRGGAAAFQPRDTSNLPYLFGNSYVLQLASNYLMLFRTSVDDEGNLSVDRRQVNSNNLHLGESGKAKVEIRSNRLSGAISLFVNDDFIAQWSESDLDDSKVKSSSGAKSGFGFVVQGSDAPVRISDVVVSEWNGMPDSARSLQVENQDVVLMANGTDRYAGKVGQLDEDRKVRFEGKHGNFRLPLDEIAEIRFARAQLAVATQAPTDNIVVRLAPIGLISGKPVSGDAKTLEILNPIMGKVNLSSESAIMLEFNASNQSIDAWDVDF